MKAGTVDEKITRCIDIKKRLSKTRDIVSVLDRIYPYAYNDAKILRPEITTEMKQLRASTLKLISPSGQRRYGIDGKLARPARLAAAIRIETTAAPQVPIVRGRTLLGLIRLEANTPIHISM
jgi:hypothetical protein